MSTYRESLAIIEAFQWSGDTNQTENPAWFTQAISSGVVQLIAPGTPGRRVRITTTSGVMFAEIGDYITRDANGDLYPRKPDVFVLTYERIA